MSKFFKALEQAERERALREQAERRDGDLTEVGPKASTAGREESSPGGSPPRAEVAFPRQTGDRPAAEGFPQHETGPAPGVVEELLDGIDQHLVSLLTPATFEAEQYLTLRHAVEQLHKNADLSVVAVSSSAFRDGKTTTAINLAGALAQAPGTRVLLVDADLRRPSVSKHLGLVEVVSRGLVDAILDPALSLEGVVRRCLPFNLAVLPAGHPPSASYEVLKSPRLGELLAEARRRYDYIVLDTPPVIPLPDCRLIGKWVDGFLVVVAAHKTPRKLVAEALNVLDPAKILGLVFNMDDHPVGGYYRPSAQSANGNWRGRLNRVVKKVGRSFRGRRSSQHQGASLPARRE